METYLTESLDEIIAGAIRTQKETGNCPEQNLSSPQQEDLKSAAEEQEKREIGFMPRLFVQTSIPHRKSNEHRFERRNGNQVLIMTSHSDHGLPYGTYARLLLCWVASQALRLRTKEIELGRSLSELLRFLEITKSGGSKGSITRIYEHMDRLFCAHASIAEYSENEEKRSKNIVPIPLFGPAVLAWDLRRHKIHGSASVIVDGQFYEEIVIHAVPIDMGTTNALARTESPMAMDIYFWLTHRFSYLSKRTIIPWISLSEQFGSDYTRARDFRRAFIQSLQLVVRHYQAADCDPLPEGLALNPSRTHIRKLSTTR